MDWSNFELAMIDPNYDGGHAVYKAEPRMTVPAVADNLEDGMSPEEVAAMYKLDVALVANKKVIHGKTVGWRSSSLTETFPISWGTTFLSISSG